MSVTWEREDHGTVPCLRCRREVRAHRSHCPFCGAEILALPSVIAYGYREGAIVGIDYGRGHIFSVAKR